MARRQSEDLSPLDAARGSAILEGRLVERRTPDGAPDPVARSGYVKRYETELGGRALAPSDDAALRDQALRADLTLLGEYHPLPGAAAHAASLLERLTDAGRAPLLGLEFAQGRDQRALDAYASGAIGGAELRDRLAYDREWGYPWKPAEELLSRARRLGVRVVGFDVAPRGGPRDLGIRDRVVARRLARLIRAGAGSLVVLFGEAHVADAHLPRALRRELGADEAAGPRILRVFHDLPARPAPARGTVWSLGAGSFACFPSGPEARRGALTRVWRRWARTRPSRRLDEESLLHALARMQLDAVGLDERRVSLPGGGVLADLFPRLVLLGEGGPAGRELRQCGVDEPLARSWLERARDEGAVFVEEAGLVLSAEGGVSTLARAAGAFCAAALATSSRRSPARSSAEGERLLVCVAEALARLADPIAEPAERAREAAWLECPRVPESAREARVVGGALARAVMARRLSASLLRSAARRARSGAKAARESTKKLVNRLAWAEDC